MKDQSKTKQVLIQELASLRQQIEELEQSESELKKEKEALKKSDAPFPSYFHLSVHGIAIISPEKGWIEVNDRICSMLGYSRHEITRLTWSEMTHPDDLTANLEQFNRVLSGQIDHYNMDKRFIRKDGNVVWTNLSVACVRKSDGRVDYMIALVLDITERKRMERVLQENDERLRGITQNLPGIIFQFYVKDNGEYGMSYISELSAEFTKILGNIDTTNLEALFPLFLSRIHEEDKDRFLASIKTAVETVTPWNFEGRSLRFGNETWFQGLSIPTRYDDQLVFDGILLNITERKLAEEKSRQSEEKFRDIFMITPDGIVISRLQDGIIMDANKGFEDITGWQREIVIGKEADKPPLNLWGDLSEPEFITRELKAGMDIANRQFEFRRRDGSIRTGIYSTRSINIAGEASIIFIMQDITEQKRMESELVESHKMKLMSQIASGVAHEVRNPLHAIQAISEAMAVDLKENIENKDYLMHIKAQVGRLSHLMRDLLDLGKPIQPSQFVPTPLTEIASSSLMNWMEAHPQLSQRVKVVSQLQSEDFVLADANKIQQVIINLMDNAVAHSPKDEEILLELSKASEKYLMVKVIDKGMGIKSEDLPRVFEPFYTTSKNGTGLGLSLCKHNIESHGGSIEIVNNIHEPGCTAWFTLPIFDLKEHI